MFKKVVIGTVATALVAVLVIGAINRTNAKAGESATGQGRGRSGETALTDTTSGGRSRQNSDTATTAGGGRWGQGSTQQATQGGRRGAQDNAQPVAPATGAAEVTEWVTLTGSVVSIADDMLTVRLADGTTIEVDGRAWTFALEQEFTTTKGDQLTLTGFYEGDAFEVGQISNDSTGKQVTLRDSSGRPLWAGRGRGRSS